MIDTGAPARSLAARAQSVAEVAAAAASEVDREARFPSEAFSAARQNRLLSPLVPLALGGEDLPFEEVVDAVRILAHGCASTSLIYAMHQIQVSCLLRHGDNDTLREALASVARDQVLLASATSEVSIGGDVRRSLCSLQPEGDGFRLTKQAPVISYGQEAEAVLATARRTPDSPPSDQVLVYLPAGPHLELEPVGEWDTLGFRGTCSLGFVLTATGTTEQVLTDPYGEISARTMLPVSHILWAATWLGLAESAAAKAHSYTRAAARKQPDRPLPATRRTAQMAASLQEFRSLLAGAVSSYLASLGDPEALESITFAVAMNSLKITASDLLIRIVTEAMGICGMSGYRYDSAHSLGRELRDAHGSALMINNDRILDNNAQLLLASKEI